MKVTVTVYLNVRVGAPSVNAPCFTYLSPGDVIEVEPETVPGDLYENNNRWYKGLDGCFYWSGGVSRNDETIVTAALEQIRRIEHPGVIGSGRLKKTQNGITNSVVQLMVADEATKDYFLNSFKIDGISPPFDIHIVSQPETQAAKFPGAGIRNSTNANGTGTFGCVVIDSASNQKALLSCQHVLKDNFDYNVMNNNTKIVLSAEPEPEFATHICGMRDSEADAGLAVLADQGANNSELGLLTGIRAVSSYDVSVNKAVSLKGYDIENEMVLKQSGIIINKGLSTSIRYENGQSFTINNLIVLSKSKDADSFQSLTRPGYSGSIVIDENNYAIGMVVGGDNKFTYAIPLDTIQTKLKFKLLV